MGKNAGAVLSQRSVQRGRAEALTDWSNHHHLYAKPLVSRCLKGQRFSEATGPGRHPASAIQLETIRLRGDPHL